MECDKKGVIKLFVICNQRHWMTEKINVSHSLNLRGNAQLENIFVITFLSFINVYHLQKKRVLKVQPKFIVVISLNI